MTSGSQLVRSRTLTHGGSGSKVREGFLDEGLSTCLFKSQPDAPSGHMLMQVKSAVFRWGLGERDTDLQQGEFGDPLVSREFGFGP